MFGPTSLDLDGFTRLAREKKPSVVYLDQSTQLEPIDPAPLREILDIVSPDTRIHYDSSHVNGLILGGALPNPLERGATSFGGSTHKTLPGPHKGFLATNDNALWERFDHFANHLVSHHQVAAVMSLAVTVCELRDCGGDRYARQILQNADCLAANLVERGITVAGVPGRWTGCHQVWASAGPGGHALADSLHEHGLVVNCLPSLPGLEGPALRLSVAELTRLGANQMHVEALAAILADCVHGGTATPDARRGIFDLRRELDRPRYCYEVHELAQLGLSDELVHLVSKISEGTRFDA